MAVSTEKLGFREPYHSLIREVAYKGKVLPIKPIKIRQRETEDGTAIDANSFLEALSRAEDILMTP